MYLLLNLLLLSALAILPMFSQNYTSFKMQHTYRGKNLLDCTHELNRILKSLNKICKPCNSFILGDKSYSTNITDVNAVCTTTGGKYKGKSKLGGKIYESKKNFRVVKCQKKTGRKPPKCVYGKVGQKDIKRKKITLTCENDHPVHFNLC